MGLFAITAPDVDPARTVGCQGLHGAKTERTPGSLETKVEEKKRRIGRRRMKSFSSPEKND